MWWKIAKHEWRILIADRSLWLLAGLFAALIIYGVFNGAAWAKFQTRTVQKVIADENEKLAAQKNEIADIEAGRSRARLYRDPRDAAFMGGIFGGGGRFVSMPPAPLAAFAVGQSDLFPYYFKVNVGGKQTFTNNDEIENPHNLLTGSFDLAFVIVYLFPLIILALSFNLLSQEKEQGTLALTLSQPLDIRSLVFGKVAVRFVSIVVSAIAFALLGAVLSGVDLSAEGAARRILYWILATAFYGAFWFGLAALVNSFGKSSATNAVALAGVWLLLVLIVPALLNVITTTLYPAASRVEIIQATRRAAEDADGRSGQLLSKYLTDHPDLTPTNTKAEFGEYFSRIIVATLDAEKQTQPVLDDFNRQLASRQQFVNRFRFLSPAVVTQETFNDLAGTGQPRYAAFTRQTDEFHQAWRGFFYPKVLRQDGISANEFAAIPQFDYAPEPSEAVRNRVLIGLLGLLAPTLLVFVFAFLNLRRYAVAG